LYPKNIGWPPGDLTIDEKKKKNLKKSLGYKHTQRSQHDQGGYALKGVNIIWVGIWHVMSGSRNQ
jgi:hypothetical protein